MGEIITKAQSMPHHLLVEKVRPHPTDKGQTEAMVRVSQNDKPSKMSSLGSTSFILGMEGSHTYSHSCPRSLLPELPMSLPVRFFPLLLGRTIPGTR